MVIIFGIESSVIVISMEYKGKTLLIFREMR